MELLKNIPKGKPKSGRVWKSEKSRFSEKRLDKTLKTSWAKKMQLKAEKKSIKSFEKQLKEDRNRQLEEKRKRQEENKKRRLENERKNEVVQPIKNTAKIKRMKKKQLRQVQKR
ncbi:coiled-coil domain-containing protein 86-like [Mercenaria mercenaria]|uniref:coiled-coil domain-containing protein 86-like n=1 Tax=Mercenaria mercenaria TaxID=6596 RepID=UPI00234EE279|nr:coiled-coil domain-containing protein 86-like [Mercenaria mercenaria]